MLNIPNSYRFRILRPKEKSANAGYAQSCLPVIPKQQVRRSRQSSCQQSTLRVNTQESHTVKLNGIERGDQ